jgi:hypothetical protein
MDRAEVRERRPCVPSFVIPAPTAGLHWMRPLPRRIDGSPRTSAKAVRAARGASERRCRPDFRAADMSASAVQHREHLDATEACPDPVEQKVARTTKNDACVTTADEGALRGNTEMRRNARAISSSSSRGTSSRFLRHHVAASSHRSNKRPARLVGRGLAVRGDRALRGGQPYSTIANACARLDRVGSAGMVATPTS